MMRNTRRRRCAGSALFALRIAAASSGLVLAACSSAEDEADGAREGQNLEGPIFGAGEEPAAEGLGFGGEVCAGQSAGAEVAPAVLQFLVDTSGSMDQNAPGARGSKWVVTRRALLDAVDRMREDAALGVVFYPNVDADSAICFDEQTAVVVGRLEGPGSAQRQRIRTAFTQQSPEGGTPTHDAYRYALARVAATPSIGARFVVLITDGVPTYSLGCRGTGRQEDAVDPSPLVAEAAAALERGIRTFVIGSPGSEGARDSLSRMAEAGGTSGAQCSHDGPRYCHFDMTRERDLGAGLANALDVISGLALGCRYDVPSPPDGAVLDPSKVNVLFTPPGAPRELILQSAGNACSEGWQYANGDTQIQLCGSTCERVRNSNGALTLEFGCATQLR